MGEPTSASAPSSGVFARRFNFGIVGAVTQQLSLYYSRAKSLVYDAMILHMTEKWYRAVLNRLDDGTLLLDVGIGTGGALLLCQDLIEAKNLKVVGIDIDAAYVEAGKLSVEQAGLSDRISINTVDVYEGREILLQLAEKIGATANADGETFDAIYFSGSFSLLPDPVKALQLVSKIVKGNSNNEADRGRIFITQTYQRKTPFFLPYVKPLLKYATTIDFGQLVREEQVLQTFKESGGLEVVDHNVIPGSVDNAYQAAYLSVLQ
ncbi:hypothetical protein ACHAXT_005192 [Thalassiosira profunda]